MHTQGHPPDLPLDLGVDPAGADLLCRARHILVGIIVKTGFGNDLHGGKGPSAEDTAGELPPLDILFHHEGVSVGQAVPDGFFEPVLFLDDVDADRGPAVRRLDDAGDICLQAHGPHEPVPGLCRLLRVAGLIRKQREVPAAEGRCPDPAGPDDHLGDHLVHGHGRSQMPGTRVGDPHQVKGGLDSSVLAVFAVHGDKDDVRGPAGLQDVAAEHGRTLPLSGLADSLEVRGLSVKGKIGHGGKVVKEDLRVKDSVRKGLPVGLPAQLFKAQIEVRQDRPVAPAAQGRADPGSGQK